MAFMNQNQFKKIIDGLATLGGVGRWPRFPGTWGTVCAIPLAVLCSKMDLMYAVVFTFLFILFSIAVCHFYEQTHAEHDSSEVVIDEVAGYLVAALAMPSWPWFIVAFVLFRFFDIVKPPPISTIDQKVSGGFGVVLDDVAAGMAANALIHFVLLGVYRDHIANFFG